MSKELIIKKLQAKKDRKANRQAHEPTEKCEGVRHYPDHQCYCEWLESEKI